jgi:ACS family hexuronate transporter-like MFS transporter
MNSPAAKDNAVPALTQRVGRFRWVICVVLLLGVTKNYMDRQVIGVLKNTLQHELGWSEIDYGNLVFAFQAAYAIGMVVVGRLLDRVGTRIGYAFAMAAWSIASIAHGMSTSVTGFLAARFGLGFAEAGVFPASIKAVAEWFPKQERALATGIFNAGSNLGAILTPLIVPWITVRWGWRWAFIFVGSLGFLWLVLWLKVYRRPEEHRHCSPAELDYIRRDSIQKQTNISWSKLIPHRQTWSFVAGKFIIDPIWYFYLFWIPDFLQRQHGLALLQLGLPIVIIYLMADAGSVAGGWISSALIRRGFSLNASRKIAMLVSAVAVTPILFAPRVTSTWTAVFLVGLAAAAHQGFSCNLLTLPSDIFPARVVGSVVGMGGMAGAIGGMLIAKIVGYLLQRTGSYSIPFLIAASAYLVALAAIHLLAPTLEPVRLASEEG